MFEFFSRLFKPERSGATARERLRLVLLSDHLALAPEIVEDLRRDLLGVIARYVEFDESAAEVSFEHREREVAMLASIPITGVRRTIVPPLAPADAPLLEPAPPAEPAATAEPPAPVETAPERAGDSAPESPSDAPPAAPAIGAKPRRRRRRRTSAIPPMQRPLEAPRTAGAEA
ncbi:MAG: cell division topological specificity factor MinE [Vulcanimicrobiaceae bacterium]